jgi:hypothetical protein
MTPHSKKHRINNDISSSTPDGYGKGVGYYQFVFSDDILDWMYSGSASGRIRRRKYNNEYNG